MSAARLTFLYPHLFRPLRVTERQPFRSSKRRCCKPPGPAYISTGSPMRESTFASRHGKAVEPAVFLMGPPKSGSEGGEGKNPDARSAKQEQAPGEQASKSTTETETLSPEERPEAQQGRQTAKNGGDSLDNGPMETVLQAGAGSPKEAAKKLPQSPRPRYIHHFDSYSLVKELEKGGFTQAQSITAMKAIRTLLAKNLHQAQNTLVSKSDVENETYLFRAACSELSTEVKNNRKAANEEMRQQRTTLQHEVDILTQTLNQELVTLGDNVKSMFNERKMAAREEQNEIASSIQELSLKISAKLNSDAKSDIEGVRWVLIRSAALGIGFAIMSGLLLIQQSRRKKVEKVKDEGRKKLEEEILKQGHGKVDHSSAPDAAEILAAN